MAAFGGDADDASMAAFGGDADDTSMAAFGGCHQRPGGRILADRFPATSLGLFDATKRPAKTAKGENLFLF